MSSLSLRDFNTTTQFRSQVHATLKHLASLEHKACSPRTSHTRPRTPRVPARKHARRVPPAVPAPTPLECVPVCTTCGTPGCHFTECPNGHYVFDTPTLPRALAPGEQLSAPATWKDLHRATLQGVLRVVAQYYCHLHSSPRYLTQARLIVTSSLGLPEETDSLLHHAVRAVTARLREDPLCNTIPGLFNSVCECYHTPVFGISLDSFKSLVRAQCPSPP